MPNTFVRRHNFTADIVTPYSAGDVLEGIITLSGLLIAGGALHSLALFNREALTPTINLHLFSASPDASTTTDNLAFVIADADDAFYLMTVQLATWLDIASKKVAIERNLGIAVPQTRSGDIFIVPELRTTFTPTDADALSLIPGILPG